jgi:hypothetical protein
VISNAEAPKISARAAREPGAGFTSDLRHAPCCTMERYELDNALAVHGPRCANQGQFISVMTPVLASA